VISPNVWAAKDPTPATVRNAHPTQPLVSERRIGKLSDSSSLQNRSFCRLSPAAPAFPLQHESNS
jgi:hypothetical protein